MKKYTFLATFLAVSGILITAFLLGGNSQPANAQAVALELNVSVSPYPQYPASPVTISASVAGSQGHQLRYRFDCTNDGTWDTEITHVATTVSGICYYPAVGGYAAHISVRDLVDNRNDTTFVQMVVVPTPTHTPTITPTPTVTPPPVHNPNIRILAPSSGKVERRVLIIGSGFTKEDNYIVFGPGYIPMPEGSLVGRIIAFNIPKEVVSPVCLPLQPEPCPPSQRIAITSGEYAVSVTNRNGTSNSKTFTVTGVIPPRTAIKVLTPNGGESWLLGSKQKISWQSLVASANSRVDQINLLRGEIPVLNIFQFQEGGGLPTVGSLNWQIPQNLVPADNYRIQVVMVAGSQKFDDFSDKPFAITSETGILSVYLNQKFYLKVGQTAEVQDYRKLHLTFDKEIPIVCITTPCYNQGQFSVSIPFLKVPTVTFNLAVGQSQEVYGAKVSMLALQNGVATMLVEAKPIQPSAIKLMFPNGGESWQAGSIQMIRWSAENVSKVTLKLRRDLTGDTVKGIAENLPNTGYYVWQVPRDLPGDDDYRVRVISDGASSDVSVWQKIADTFSSSEAAESAVLFDDSDKPFSITSPQVTPTVTPTSTPDVTVSLGVVSPNGGEGWMQGESHKISWRVSQNPDGALQKSGMFWKISLVKYIVCIAYPCVSPETKLIEYAVLDFSSPQSWQWLPVQDIEAGNYQIKVSLMREKRCLTIINCPKEEIVQDHSDNYFTILPLPSTPTPTPTCTVVDCAAPPQGCTYQGGDPCVSCGVLVCSSITPIPTLTPTPTGCLGGPIGCIRITVNYPKGGETWNNGTTQTIKWSYNGAVAKVNVGLISWYPLCTAEICPEQPVRLYTLGRSVANTGSFAWIVGKDINGQTISSGKYLVQVSDAASGRSDYSDGAVSISPLILQKSTILDSFRQLLGN